MSELVLRVFAIQGNGMRSRTDINELSRLLRVALTPIFIFALVSAVICWTCAWIFYERYEFSATFLGFGCGGIVVALCSYLYVLTTYVRIGAPGVVGKG